MRIRKSNRPDVPFVLIGSRYFQPNPNKTDTASGKLSPAGTPRKR